MPNITRFPGSVDVGDTAYYTGTAIPGVGDSLYFLEGEDKLSANMTALVNDLALIAFAPGNKTTFSVTALAVTVDQSEAGIIKYEGSANGTLKFVGQAADNDVGSIFWWSNSPSARGEFDAMDILENVEVTAGSVYIGPTALFAADSEVWVIGGDIHIAAHATDVVPLIEAKAGSRTVIKRAFTDLNVAAGAWVEIDLGALAGVNITNNGGTIVWLSGDISGTFKHLQGDLDISKFKRIGQAAANWVSTAKARVFVGAGSAQPTLGSSTSRSIGSSRGAQIMTPGSGYGGGGFGGSA